MVLLFWAIVMRVLRFLEIPSGHIFELPSPDGNFCYGKERRCGGVMTEDNSQTISIRVREADCNSNVTMSRTGMQFDSDWLLGLGGGGGSKYQTSIFSQDTMISYDDLSRNIDANLAEIDIEDFRSEDIHSILTLPAMFSGEFEPEKHGEQIASMSGSLLLKFEALDSASSVEQRSSDSDVSMCRSGPLFSPAREAPPMPSFSVDSLDCESYDEHELMLTCQANKGNYTITFEGSYTRCSDDSDYHDAGVSDESTSWPEQRFTPPAKSGSPADNSMVQSDYVYTTWSKLKLTNDAVRQKNNGSAPITNRAIDLNASTHVSSPCTGKSQSLPNLLRQSLCGSDLRLSQLNVSRDSEQCVPVFDLQASQSSSASSSQHSFSLMRLFIQQKGCSGSLESSSLSMESGQDSSAHINRPNPNLCTTLPPDKKLQHNKDNEDSSMTNLELVKEDAVQLHKNLMMENEKGTNVSSSRNHLHGTDKLEDSLTGPICEESPIHKQNEAKIEEDDDSDDVEMISIEDNKPDSGVCNNTIDIPYNTTVWEARPSSVDMINNFFPTSKSNNGVQRIWKESLSPTSLSQGTQTKQLNSKESSPTDSPHTHLQLNNARVDSQQVTNRAAPTLINNRQASVLNRKLNVTIATMRSLGTQIPVHVVDQAVQTSFIDEFYNASSKELSEKDCQSKSPSSSSESEDKKSVLVCYPNYALPDLSFLRSSLSSSLNSARMYLLPQTLKSPTSPSSPTFAISSNESPVGMSPTKRRDHRPHSCPDMDSLRNRSFQHIHDWDSLSVLLPREVRNFLGNNSEGPDPATDIPRFYRSERGRSGRPNVAHRGHDAGTSTADLGPPPLPKRSISLPSGHVSHNDVDIPRSILRKPSPSRSDVSSKHRLSLYDTQCQAEGNKENHRRSLQEVTRHTNDKVSMKPQPCNSTIVLTTKNNSDVMLPNHLTHNLPTRVHAFPTTKIDKVEARHENLPSNTVPVQNIAYEQETNIQCEAQMYCMCDRHRGKKSVSFSENVCIRESFTPEGGNSPEGSPAGESLLNQQVVPQELPQPQQAMNILHSGFTSNCFMKPPLVSDDLEIESPPNEFCVSPLGSNSPCNSPRMQEPQPSIKDIVSTKETEAIYDVQQKKDLVLAVNEAVDVLLSHFGQARDSQEKYQLGNSNLTPACGNKVLKWLCPAIHAVLDDGLQPQLYSLFGHIQNSVWSVIEASVQSAGPTTRALNDLVIRLNAEDDLKQNISKFNSFVFGLLNIRSLDTWLAYLRSRDFLLKKHYHPHSLLSLATSGGRCLFDDLLLALQPLSTLPFELDLLFEVYNVNVSPAMKWEENMESPTKHSNMSNYKQRVLSHQNNENYLVQTIGKETKEFQNQQARQAQQPDSEKSSLSANAKRGFQTNRPRSYIDDSSNNGFFTDIASSVKRRWSGIHIGSRLLNAFDPRNLDDDWSVQTDQDHKDLYLNASSNRKEMPSDDQGIYTTLSRPKPEGAADGGQADICATQQQQIASQSFQNKNNIPSSKKATVQKSTPVKPDNVVEGHSNMTREKGGQQFKKLQQKWEELSAKSDAVIAKGTIAQVEISEIENPVNNVGLPSNRSRIPRLVAPARQTKMDDSVISLRSSASGQSSQSQEKQESFSDEVNSPQKITSQPLEKVLTSPTNIYETPLPTPGSRLSQENSNSPRKRPLTSRTLSSPAAPGLAKGASSKANKNQELRRPPSPPRSKSGLPRKIGSRNSDNLDQDAGINVGRRK